MNAPTLYILIPILVGIALLILKKRAVLIRTIGVSFSFLWGIIGFTLPIGEVVLSGDSVIKISSSTLILGRNLSILDSDRPLVGTIFTMCACWFLAVILKRVGNHFIPIGLVISGLLIATIAIEPFLYSALILAIIVLLSVLLFSEPGKRIGAGIIRYIVFQMLGVPFILLTGWVLTVAGVNPSDEIILLQAILFIIIGFALMLGIFPFHTWIPMLASEGNIIGVGFIFSLMPPVIFVMLLDYINSYSWLRESPLFFQAIFFCGILMLVTGGIWAVFQNEPRKLFGCAVMIETGFSLLALGLNSQIGYLYVVMSTVPRIMALFLISLSISQLEKDKITDLQPNSGQYFHRKPWAVLGLYAGFFCVAGIPFSAAFPLRLQLIIETYHLQPATILGIAIGIIGILIGCTRMAYGMNRQIDHNKDNESRLFISIVIALLLFLFLTGLLPGHILSSFTKIITGFPYLK